MIGRVSDRTSFVALRRQGHRARSGPVTVVMLPDGSVPPRFAYAVGRRVGNAVARNRLRRRLRAVVGDLAGRDAVAPGTYLVSPRPEAAAASPAELSADVARALRRVARGSEPRPAGAG